MYVYVYPITVPVQERIVISANAHNLFLNNFIENGLIGFSSIIFLIIVYLKISVHIMIASIDFDLQSKYCGVRPWKSVTGKVYACLL